VEMVGTPRPRADGDREHGERDRTTRRRYAHARRRKRSWPVRLGYALASLAIAGGLAIGAHIYLFYQHSDQVGSALIHAEEKAATRARVSGKCVSTFPTSSGAGSLTTVSDPGSALAAQAPVGATTGDDPTVYELLKAPSIGLVAPVVNGDGDAQLSVAVGHVVASSWPGVSGTSVLAAHDVTWFSHLDHLAAGDELSVETPCQTFQYSVDSNQVVAAGTAIDQTSTGRLVLITCYPLDALFLTPKRLVVEATLTRVIDDQGSSHGPSHTPATVPSPVVPVTPSVPAPAPLAAQGLDLSNNAAPLGSLAVTGSPSTSWQQSSGPLDDETAVLELYFAALRSAGQDQPNWWAAIAPGVPFSAASPLVGARITHNDSTLSPSLDVTGAALTGATLSTEPVLSGNHSPGIYRITMTAGVVNGQLVLTGWTMQHA
jgi:sortase A